MATNPILNGGIASGTAGTGTAAGSGSSTSGSTPSNSTSSSDTSNSSSAIGFLQTFLTADHVYEATLTSANNSGVHGFGLFAVHGNDLTVLVDATGLEPGQVHPMHIHGFSSGEPSAVPTAAADTDHDGFVEDQEAEAVAGPPLLPLTSPPGDEANGYPTADANGGIFFTQTFHLQAGQSGETTAGGTGTTGTTTDSTGTSGPSALDAIGAGTSTGASTTSLFDTTGTTNTGTGTTGLTDTSGTTSGAAATGGTTAGGLGQSTTGTSDASGNTGLTGFTGTTGSTGTSGTGGAITGTSTDDSTGFGTTGTGSTLGTSASTLGGTSGTTIGGTSTDQTTTGGTTTGQLSPDNLDLRVLELHGMTVAAGTGAGTSGEVDGTGGYKMDLPVASGHLHQLDGTNLFAQGSVLGDLLRAELAQASHDFGTGHSGELLF